MSQESQLIAEIPQDILGSSGKILTSDVYGIAGTQRKKRLEVALAVDRQTVDIYDVRQSKLVSSYVVSPQATFTCPPCSLRYRTANRASDSTSAHRLTFCSIHSPTARLYRFHETFGASASLENQISSTFVDLKEQSSPIVHLETKLEADRNNSPNCLLAVYQNGSISCYTESLEKEIWSSSMSIGEDQQVLLASLTDVEQARKGLLKRREDILASFGQAESDQTKDLIVLLTCTSIAQSSVEPPKLSLQILDISKPSVAFKGSEVKPRRLFSIDVPRANDLKLEESSFALHPASGCLYQQTADSVIVFDMTDLLPKVIYDVAVGESDMSSFLRLSSHTLALGRRSLLSLVSLPYCSIQAESNADTLPNAKHGDLRLVSYFESLKTLAAIKGRCLIAIQLPDTHSRSVVSRKRQREGALIESIGRGSYTRTRLPVSNDTSDLYIENLGLLSSFSKDEAWESQKAKWAKDGSTRRLKDLFDAMITEDDMRNLKTTPFIDQQKVSFLLGRIFHVQRTVLAKDGNADNRLQLKITSLNRKTVFKWLLQKGYFTKQRIEDSLKHIGSLNPSEILAPAAIIDAISKEDPSLKLLTLLLSSQVPLDPVELVAALATVITLHDTSEPPEDQKKLLTDSNTPPQPQVNHQSLTLTNSLYQHLIRLLLVRFAPLPPSSITSAFRTHLSKSSILYIIDALRLQIATAGWFSPYDSDPKPPDPSSPAIQNSHLLQITHLLNSTIDAIGTGGWILGASHSPSSGIINGASDDHDDGRMAEAANTVSYMKAEISAALEGIQEAVYLQGMLAEVLLCGKDALGKQPQQSKRKDQGVSVAVKGIDGNSSALPLGLKLAKTVSRTKVGAGGELIERSRRDIRRLESRMVGKYSFERLVV